MKQVKFKISTDLTPRGDQPQAIEKLIEGFTNKGYKNQVLLGVTGSGKSLDYADFVLVKNSKGQIVKTKIGEFIDQYLVNPLLINDTEYQKIDGYTIQSFNPQSYKISENKIIEISRHKISSVIKVTLDDGSEISITDDHNCFRLNNARLELTKTNDLKIGDYLPTATSLPIPTIPNSHINLLDFLKKDYNLSITSFLVNNKDYHENAKLVLQKTQPSPYWKFKQVLQGTASRGLTQSEVNNILKPLTIEYEDISTDIKIINSHGDQVSPIIPIDDLFLTFAGIYVAEGHNTSRYILISNTEVHLQNLCKMFYDQLGLHYNQRDHIDIQFNSKIMAEFFTIFGKNSHSKRIPSLIYNLSNYDLTIFLRSFFDGDGWVEVGSVCFSTVSKELAFDIKNLLLRYKITSRIHEKYVKYEEEKKLNFLLSITGQANLLIYQSKINFSISYKAQKLKEQIGPTPNTNVDIFPNSSNYLKKVRISQNWTQQDMSNIMNCSRSHISLIENGKRSPSLNKIKKLAYEIQDEELLNLTNFNYRQIVKIERIKPTNDYVYDFSVERNENFAAGVGNIFVHNTFSASRIINELNKPTLVIAPNKTLAAQLYAEFKQFFPDNQVEYFVSFYDYYQPEAYMPTKDLYIAKDFNINEEIEKLRNSTTRALAERNDVIVVASVSCIYNVGMPETYRNAKLEIKVGDQIDRDDFLRQLIDIQYSRNEIDFKPKTFRAKGERVEIKPIYQDEGLRIEFFGDEIDALSVFDTTTGNKIESLKELTIFPATQYLTRQDMLEGAITEIRQDLVERQTEFESSGNLVAAERITQRTNYDIEQLEQLGFCSGIENYSRYFDGRIPGDPPYTLIDHFPKDFFLIIDESHQTIPQIHGMHGGDFSRKQNLVEHGFRLPSAYDNRPLRWKEFEKKMSTTLMMSATPADYELRVTEQVVEQIIRPTGLLDPKIDVRKTKNQIDDLFMEIKKRMDMGERTLVTTLTKRMAEDLADYFIRMGLKSRYMHSDIDTLDRVQILNELRLGEIDVLVGINLLREGLDLPEVSLVAILDADKQGFLRSTRSLIQIIGRAARNVNGQVLLYANTISDSMKEAITENNRRRKIQIRYNKKHGITPKTIVKGIYSVLETLRAGKKANLDKYDLKDEMDTSEVQAIIFELTELMREAAENLEFETAAEFRDKIRELEQAMIVDKNN